MSDKKEIKALVRRLVRAGCTVTVTGGCHYKVTAPNGSVVILARTPSDPRSHLNQLARLRRVGVEL